MIGPSGFMIYDLLFVIVILVNLVRYILYRVNSCSSSKFLINLRDSLLRSVLFLALLASRMHIRYGRKEISWRIRNAGLASQIARTFCFYSPSRICRIEL